VDVEGWSEERIKSVICIDPKEYIVQVNEVEKI